MNPDPSYPNLGKIVIAAEVPTESITPRRRRNIILLLTASVALTMTGFGIIFPIFARRLGEFGSGVESLALMTAAFGVGSFVAAPIMGSLADRFGRKPVILVSLGSFVVTNIAFIFAPSTPVFVVIWLFEGGLSAGLLPAALGVVADIVPARNRGRWIGIVMGSMGFGIAVGPVSGGFLYDFWGFQAPFIASAALGFVTASGAAVFVPETRTQTLRRRETLHRQYSDSTSLEKNGSLWRSIPRPVPIFGMLLFLEFMGEFSFSFVEPQMTFYFFEDLGWSTVRFGVVIGAWGLAMMLGQLLLGQASDRYGRKPVIVIGTLLTSSIYFGMVWSTSFPVLTVAAAFSGLGMALVMPASTAFILDMTQPQHRSRIVGITESSLSLGGVVGALALFGGSFLVSPQGIFLGAGILVAVSTVLAIVVLKTPASVTNIALGMGEEYIEQRAAAAQATLRGIIVRANTARETQ